jgi:predicted nucleic acid-binding protein
MIVVSNTSPLTNLAAIRQFELLHLLYAHIHIADAVWEELNSEDEQWPGSVEVAAADWIETHTVRNRPLVNVLRRDLDLGESESIALAVELGADMVLMDEKEGRHAAQRLGLNVLGVVGVLLEAKSRGFIEHARPHLDALRQTAGFYLKDSLYHSTLVLASEKPG